MKLKHMTSRVRRDHPRCRNATWICMCGHTSPPLPNVYFMFHRNPFMEVLEPQGGGENCPMPITLAIGLDNC